MPTAEDSQPPPSTPTAAVSTLPAEARSIDKPRGYAVFIFDPEMFEDGHPIRPRLDLGAVAPEVAFPVGRDFLKRLPDGRLVNLMVQVSFNPVLDSTFAADGWDIVRAGPVSVRVKLES